MRGESRGLPGTCQVGLKEWAGVVAALLAGRQSVLLRKGGIEEGPGGFSPEHRCFWLYPTAFHQGSDGLREREWVERIGPPEPGKVVLPGLATVDAWWWVDREDLLRELEGEHIWTESAVLKRFAYRRKGLWVIAVRAYRAREARRIEELPEYGGCKSWVPLGEAVETGEVEEVLSEEEAKGIDLRLTRILGEPAGGAEGAQGMGGEA